MNWPPCPTTTRPSPKSGLIQRKNWPARFLRGSDDLFGRRVIRRRHEHRFDFSGQRTVAFGSLLCRDPIGVGTKGREGSIAGFLALVCENVNQRVIGPFRFIERRPITKIAHPMLLE